MSTLIDFTFYSLRAVLPILLQDKTTKRNIIWATDAYAENGDGFLDKQEIKAPRLMNFPSLIKPRIEKTQEDQQDRTRKKAEVFTPAWLCNRMNNYCDESWFGRKNVFNIENSDHTWDVVQGKVEMPEGRTWKQYVDSRRLEITCGEGPFLVSRYDAATGRKIEPPKRRIGLLDRKLRIVNENTDTYDDWLKWAVRAFEASYGFEYQGDSLLIARINLLLTFVDYYEERWNKEPDIKLLKKIANKIAWNIWQMDGFQDTVPLGMPPGEFFEPSLFESYTVKTKTEGTYFCKIQNWRKERPAEYHQLKEEYCVGSNSYTKRRLTMGKKKFFDCQIGNPPYQQSDGGAGASAKPVYNIFLEEVKKLNPEYMCFVIPAKWYSGGKGLDQFREDMLTDNHISVLEDYTNSGDVFNNVDIAGGVCVFLRNANYTGQCYYTNHFNGVTTSALRDLNEFDAFIRYPLAVGIIKKVKALQEATLDKMVSARKPFGLSTSVKPAESGDITLRYRGGKGPFERSKILVGNEIIGKWKIIISYLTAEHAGQPDKNGQFRVLSTMEEMEPGEVCTETYLVAGAFDTKVEADNYMAYLKTKFVRFLLQQIAITQHISRSTFRYIPVQDFKEHWTDEKLYAKYKLTSEEVNFIEKMIKEMK